MNAKTIAAARPSARMIGRLAFTAVVLALSLVVALTGCTSAKSSDTTAPQGSQSTGSSRTGEPSADPRPGESSKPAEPASVLTRVVRGIDGDTVAVKPVSGVLPESGKVPGEHVVRLLGIDAPEMNKDGDGGSDPECGAKAAADHLGGILPVGMPITVTFDPASDRTDQYGRSLAYVSTPTIKDVALKQIADGYAMPWHPKDKPQPSREAVYRMAADASVIDNRGLHSQCEKVGRG